jgi:hypothetical protein
MNKITGAALALLFFSFPLFSVELGIIGGTMTNPSELNYGLSGTLGLFVPLLKMEFEFSVSPDSDLMAFCLSAKLRPKFGKLAPFAVVGAGATFEKINFDFDQYEFFTLIGGGVQYFIGGFFSFRVDIRFQNFSDMNRIRFAGGIFLHL